MELPAGYRLRQAKVEDAAIIAAQRGLMMLDTGSMTSEAVREEQELWTGWLRNALAADEYVGLLVEHHQEVVAGAGLLFHSRFPSRHDSRPLKAHLLNMYVAPGQRRRGLAEALVKAALNEACSRGLRTVSLNASRMGQGLYERLGFVAASIPAMQLTLEGPP